MTPLRPGNAGSNTARTTSRWSKTCLRSSRRRCAPGCRSAPIRIGGTKKLLKWLTRRNIAYPVAFTIDEQVQQAILAVPATAWTPAYDGGNCIAAAR